MSENTGLDQPFYVGAAGVVAPPPPPPGGGGTGTPPTGTGGTSGASTAVSLLVPGSYPVALAGHPYLLDLATSPVSHQPIPLLKQQFDSAALPGEQSLSHDILWRRPQDSWHHGTGQSYLDKADSDPERFRASKGIDVWDRWEFELLQDVDRKYTITDATTFPLSLTVGTYFYIAESGALKWSQDLTTFTSANVLSGEGAVNILGIATDGNTIYAALGVNGIHTTVRGATTSTHYSDVLATNIGYARGRLMAASFSILYNVIAAGAAPTPLYTHPNADFQWVGFAESGNHIYAAGFSGSTSFVYKTAVKPDGTALDVPSVAAELPDGEVVRAIQGYLGFILIGSDLGVRLAQTDANGNLTLGALIKTPAAVFCFEAQDRFVWFGYSNYDATSTGLGRIDLSVFTAPLAPAYASDLMATTQGVVTSVNTFQNRRVFTVGFGTGAKGLYAENLTRKVASGYLDSGMITFGLPDPKVAFYVDVRYKSLAGTHKAYIATSDGGAFTLLGTHTATSGTGQFSVGQLKSDVFEIREELYRDATLTNTGPIITRHTLKAEPAADTGIWITAPLLLSSMDHVNGSGAARDPLAELDFIQRLRADQTLVFWQEGNSVYQVVVDDYQWQGMKWSDRTRNFEGTCVTKMKVVV
jgi:hypothetical protein